MNNDLISREALIKAVEDLYEYAELGEVLDVIKEAPAVELTETEIQEVLNKRCMSAVANDYLIALHGKRPQGEWVRKEDLIHYIATQYSEHNELVPVWLSIGDLKGGAE